MTKKIVFAGVVLLLIAAAVLRLAPQVLSANAQAEPAAVPVVANPESDGPQRITLDQNHQTIHVKVGGSVFVALGEGDWTLQVSDQSVAQRVKNIMLIRGAQGLYDIKQAGQTKISAQNGSTSFEVTLVAR